MSTIKVGYRYLFDPDYTPENGHYYDDTAPCSHGHHYESAKDSGDDASPPPLIDIKDIKTFEYVADHADESTFPAYPEFASGYYDQDKLPLKIEDTKSLWRKNLEAHWDYCWGKIIEFLLYCKPLIGPLIKFYHQVYIPYVLVNLLNILGGPAHAGRIGRYARICQYIGASLAWGVLIVLMIAAMSFTTVWSLGLAAPLWALIIGFSGVGINMTASLVAAAANHGKIEPYYHEEQKLHGENNALRKALDLQTMELEHGFLHSSKERQNVHLRRYGHDAQTWIVGTGSSMAATILEFASIAVGLGGIFLMISRFSSIASLFGATYVNQDRLSLFKKVISKKINAQYGLKNQLNSAKHKAIYQLLSKKLNDLQVDKNHYYSRWIKFYCYRAIDAAYTDEKNIQDNINKINQILHKELEHKFNRSSLRSILTPDGLSVLESMPILENSIRDALESSKNPDYIDMAVIVNDFSAAYMHAQDADNALFLSYLKLALIENDMKNITKDKLEQAIKANAEFFHTGADGFKILNKEKISKTFPFKGPHGEQIISDYHAKKLVDHMIIPTLQNQKEIVNINQILNTFYKSNMAVWDASSFLFILHMKSALIKNSIKDITQEKIKEVMQFGEQFFPQENGRYVLNKEKISQEYPIDDQHGGLAEPDDHARELVQRMIIPYLEKKYTLNYVLKKQCYLNWDAYHPSKVFK